MEIYLTEDTKYLTNHGLKYDFEITENDRLAVISLDNELYFTNDFEFITKKFDSMILQTDEYYKTLLSDVKVNFKYSCDCLPDELPSQITFDLDDKVIDTFTKDYAIVLSLFVSNYFKETEDNSLINNGKVDVRLPYRVFSSLNKDFGVYFKYNKISKCYTIRLPQLFLTSDNQEKLLLFNMNIFKSVVRAAIKTRLVNKRKFAYMHFNSYKAGQTFLVLLSLCGYRGRLAFDKDRKMFKVTFIKDNQKLDEGFEPKVEVVNYKSPIETKAIRLATPGKIIISQNINKNTTISILNIS